MRRVLVAAVVLAAVVSCQKRHPVSVYVNERFTDIEAPGGAIEKIAVLGTASSLHPSADPDAEAPRTVERFLVRELDGRRDYKFIAPTTVDYAVTQNGWTEQYQRFLKSYAVSDKADVAFLVKVAVVLNCDAFLIPVVDLWQKDEVDFQEDSTPATYVGATITILDAKEGTVLFRASDEDYIEGARSETKDRSIVTGASGAVYADLGAKVHRAPPFEDVAAKVAKVLAASLPPR